MAARILICVSAAGASVARWNGKIAQCAHFDESDAGIAQFESYLRSIKGIPVHVVVDTVDEDYRFETLPHTSGGDRKQLIERKLKQLYRTTPYVSATLQDRDKGKRKDDRFLFCALTNTELLAPWLEAIEARDLPLAGIYPVATTAVAAVTKLKLKSPNLLLISKHAAGLRQTFLKNGRFRITRLTPMRSGGDRTIDRSFAEEVSNTRMYLDALSITTADETVQVVILDQDNSLAALREALNNARGNLQCDRITREELVLKLRVPAPTLAVTPDALPLYLLGEHVPEENLAPAAMRQGYSVYRNARRLYAASGAFALLGAIWFGFDLYQLKDIDAQTRDAADQAAKFHARYQELTRQFPATPVPSATLKQTVDTALRLRETARTPETLFAVISEALEGSPTITLTSLGWKHGRYADAQAAFAPAGATGGAGDGSLRQVGLIVGDVRLSSGDYRTAVATIREFAEQLRKNPSVADVKILKLPLDENSRQTLSGSTSTRAEQQASAQFEIAVTLRESARAAS
jgi:hypothetical protein